MKLSSQLQQDHDSGDHGQFLEGYAQAARNLERDNMILRELSERLARLLRESAKSANWPSPLEINSALNKAKTIFANIRRTT